MPLPYKVVGTMRLWYANDVLEFLVAKRVA